MAGENALVADGDKDRPSSLPDGILCYILSFLPTIYSVRTCVLSTRWKHLFTLVPILDFDFLDLMNIPSRRRRFIDFVNYVFILYNVSRMKKFKLQFFNTSDEHFPISSWISAAINRNVEYMSFRLSLDVPLTISRDIFSCKTLTKLELEGAYAYVALPRSVCLPCLRTCILIGICFDDKSARMLFKSCPVLERLKLKNCHVRDGVEFLHISSPTLKNLSIRKAAGNSQIVINVPNLVSFKCYGPAMIEFFGLESLKSVVDACINYDLSYEPIGNTGDGFVVKLVRAIDHVRELILSFQTIEAFLRSGQQLPTFNNLTRLTIGQISSCTSMLLPCLLDSSPRLEFLSFVRDKLGYFGDNQDIHLLPERVPACVAMHLKEVDFDYFFGLDYDLNLIRYFLKYAKNLVKMKIISVISWNEPFEISSPGCEFVFSLLNVDVR